MDKFSKMIFLQLITIGILFTSNVAELDAELFENHHNQFNSFHKPRNRREVDGEDVINRFEIERVSPLYDIIRHLPPFDDGWIPNPVIDFDFPPANRKKFKNESSKFGEFKLEVSKDEEHVVSKNGRQFQENTALNWYYSAESYTSINNNNNTNSYEPQVEMPSPKTFTTRQLDEEHVVSHVPSLRGGSGTFIDFNLLQSSTTPKVDVTASSQDENPKPKIETRYILLQSGRVVAINVTSAPSVYKPNSPGSTNKNPNLPTFFFGSRIRNKNSTKASTNSTKASINSTNKIQDIVTTIQPTKAEFTTKSSKTFADQPIPAQPKLHPPTTVKPVPTTKSSTESSTNKRLPKTHSDQYVTIKPQLADNKSQKLMATSLPKKVSQTVSIKPHVTYTKMQNQKAVTLPSKLSQYPTFKPHVTYTKSLHQKEVDAVINVPSRTNKDATLDAAEKWWKEMKAANRERKTTVRTTLKPKISTQASRNILDALIDVLQPSTVFDLHFGNTFGSIKRNVDDFSTSVTTESNTKAETSRNWKDKESIIPKLTIADKKAGNIWATTPSSVTKARSTDLITTLDRDILEPSVPLSEVRHDFVRIVTQHPYVISSTETNTGTTSSSNNAGKGSSRRPRYRGLSHINLQSPKQTLTAPQAVLNNKPTTSQQLQVTTTAPKRQSRQQFLLQHTTESPRRQSFQLENALLTSLPPRQLRPQVHQLTTVAPKRQNHQQFREHQTTESPKRSVMSLEDAPIIPSPPRQSRHGFFLRNSVSFQTIPPGSLTDRRTLTSYSQISSNDTIENKPPPIEDLLIISFEPTRKSVWTKFTEDATEKSILQDHKARNFRNPVKHLSPAPVLSKKQDFVPKSTPKPTRKASQKSLEGGFSKDGPQPRSDGGNRVGRHFRPNNSRQQIVASTEASTSSSPNTKQPFRVYYFEPKRKKAQNTETIPKNGTSKVIDSVKNKRNNNTGRSQPAQNRAENFNRGQVRNTWNNETPSNRRQAKQLSAPPRVQDFSTEEITTPKAVSKRLRASPFIWHRPNVGTTKPVLQDSLIEVPANGASSQSPNSRFANNDGYYRPTKTQRTG